MANVSIITPWHNCPELIKTYERGMVGAEVIIIDNASDIDTANALKAMCQRLGGIYHRNDENKQYSAANNQGANLATGDIILFANNDIETPPGWVDAVASEVKDGALYGPSKLIRMIGGIPLEYIEGYCIAGTRQTWESIGYWDSDTFVGMYWEDNDVCYRAQKLGYKLIETDWPVWHFGNYTSRNTRGAYDNSKNNYEAFTQKIKAEIGTNQSWSR